MRIAELGSVSELCAIFLTTAFTVTISDSYYMRHLSFVPCSLSFGFSVLSEVLGVFFVCFLWFGDFFGWFFVWVVLVCVVGFFVSFC